MLNDERFMAAVGRLSLASAQLEWMQVAMLLELDPRPEPAARPTPQDAFGLARDRRAKEIRSGLRRTERLSEELRALVRAWLIQARPLLAERDEVLHAVLVADAGEDGATAWYLSHGRTDSTQPADTAHIFELGLRIGGCSAMGITLLNRLTAPARPEETL